MCSSDLVRTPEQTARLNELYKELERKSSGLPSAPHVTSTQGWTDLGLKRALKEAAEGGYDKMIWTPGEEQAKRYDLSQVIGNITARPTTDGKIRLEALTPDLSSVVHNGIYEPDYIDNVVGKEIAEKIRNQIQYPKSFDDAGKSVELNNLDLKVGGEGMKSFYDKILPTQLQKLVKKLDPNAKIEMGGHELGTGKYQVVMPNGKVVADYPHIESAKVIAKNISGAKVIREPGTKTHVLHITPELRQKILDGLPAFAEGGEVDDEVAKASGGAIVPVELGMRDFDNEARR